MPFHQHSPFPTKWLAALGLALLTALPAGARWRGLEREIKRLAAGTDAGIGVSVRYGGREICAVGGQREYPLMSVFKLHQAMAVLDSLERAGASADEPVYVAGGTLTPGTYSPLRDRYGAGGFEISLRRLMTYTLTLSDNHACDLLLHHFGGPAAVERYVRTRGCSSTRIGASEDDMHRSAEAVWANRARPADVTRLLESLLAGTAVGPESGRWLRQTLENCRTGSGRLAAGLKDPAARLGHKTGTSDRGKDGRLIALNDAGYVLLPDGRHYTIAVFVSRFPGTTEEAEQLIAAVSATVFRHITDREDAR